MSVAVRTAIEDGVIERLQPLKAAGRLRALEPYNGQLEGVNELEDARRRLQGVAPAILVSTTDGRFTEFSVNKRRVKMSIQVELLVITRNQSTREDRTRDADAGVYMLMQEAARLLIGHVLNATDYYSFCALSPEREAVLDHSADMCMWRQTYTVAATLEAHEDAALTITAVNADINAPTDEDNAGDPLVQVDNT